MQRKDFIQTWPSDNFDEFDLQYSDSVSDCLSQLCVHIAERGKSAKKHHTD